MEDRKDIPLPSLITGVPLEYRFPLCCVAGDRYALLVIDALLSVMERPNPRALIIRCDGTRTVNKRIAEDLSGTIDLTRGPGPEKEIVSGIPGIISEHYDIIYLQNIPFISIWLMRNLMKLRLLAVVGRRMGYHTGREDWRLDTYGIDDPLIPSPTTVTSPVNSHHPNYTNELRGVDPRYDPIFYNP